MSGIDVDLLRSDVIVFAEGTPVEDVVSELRDVGRQTSKHDKTGCAWAFPKRRRFGLDDAIDELSVGIRGEVGTLAWHDLTGGYVPTGGEYSHWAEYFMSTFEYGVFCNADGVDLPLETVLDAVREYARTFKRPTCIDWTNIDDVIEYPVPHTNIAEVFATPDMGIDDVLGVLASQDRPRSWRLFIADEETETNLRRRAVPRGPTPPTLWFGLGTDERGFALWEEASGCYLPVHGGGDQSSFETFGFGDSFAVTPVGSAISNAEVEQAIREVVATRQRPTCVEWIERP